MLEKILELLGRAVVALEMIAVNTTKMAAGGGAPAAEEDDLLGGNSTPTPAKEVTVDEVLAATKAKVEELGDKTKVVALIKEFGQKKASDIDKAKFAEYLK